MLESRLNILRKSAEIHSPQGSLDEKSARLVRLRDKLDVLAKNAAEGKDNEFKMLLTRLEGVNPLVVLSHGYAMVQGADGRVISKTDDAETGEKIDITLSDGIIRAEIVEKEVRNG